ncbi:MAG: protoporphyrinogen oxidase, partial [Anaerolinea sp.]|nr:protoporphyrinogen oxidase [Anaerolinea sp.]
MNIAAGEQALKIAVIGGGISGLAAAYTIQEASRAKNLNVTVFLIEAENRLGGKILTE